MAAIDTNGDRELDIHEIQAASRDAGADSCQGRHEAWWSRPHLLRRARGLLIGRKHKWRLPRVLMYDTRVREVGGRKKV